MSRTAALAALLAAVALAGCLGGGPDTAMSQEAKQIQNESLDAMADVDAYELDAEMRVQGADQTVEMALSGAVNRSARMARVEVQMRSPRSLTTTTYIDGRTAYVDTAMGWQRRTLPADYWSAGNRLQTQREVFAASTMDIAGTDVVDGTPVTVVDITVPDDQLDELLSIAQRTQPTGPQGSITDAAYTAHIANETGLLRRVEVDMTMEVDGQSFDATVDMRFSHFGEPTPIAIPDAATDQRARVG